MKTGNPIIQNNEYGTYTPVYIPKTPGPKPINDIQTQARERFAGIIYIDIDSEEETRNTLLDYDNWELYDENKSYSKRKYHAVYNNTLKEYQNYLCIFNYKQEQKYYVVSKRVHGELEELEPFCTCIRCSAMYFNPLKYIWCPQCTRCIKAGQGFAKNEYIEKAKILKSANEDKKIISHIDYRKYINGTKWIKIIEVLIILFFIVLIYLFF